MRCSLAPSILSFDLANLRETVRTLDKVGAPVLHLDVMDGQFVPPITFGDAYVKALRPYSEAVFEAHLMTLTPERHFDSFAAAGCNRILYHLEATPHAHRLAQSLLSMRISPGIVLNPGTPVEAALPLLGVVDMVLVMTVNPGWGGQAFISSAVDKVRALREIAGPELLIEVDGGIDRETLRLARSAGANVFVVGSHLAKAVCLDDELEEMIRLCE
jgi:ribulose-phosphate 3-epimerase